MRVRLPVSLALVLCLAAAVASAQARYTVDGVVVDQNGKPIPGARITLGQSSQSTDASGEFHFQTGDPGPFQATVVTKSAETLVTLISGSFERVRVADIKGKTPRTSKLATVAVNDLEASGKAKSNFDKAEKALNHGDLAGAQKYAGLAIQASPRWARPYALRGMIELEANNNAAAKTDLQTAVANNPQDWMSRTELAKLDTATGDYADSRQQLERALQLPPPHWQTYAELAQLDLRQRNFAEAAEMAANALQAQPPAPPSLHFIAGEAQFNLARYDLAAQEFSQFLKLVPPSPAFAATRAAAQRALSQAESRLRRPQD